ncbi:MAG: phenylalanine--tRNA ligase subunit alpha [bacterium]
MKAKLEELKQNVLAELEQADTLAVLNELRVKYLGKKGLMTEILRGMGKLSSEERPIIGQLANQIRNELEELLAEKLTAVKEAEKQQRLEAERLDITLPGKKPALGHKHPLTKVIEEVEDIFISMGFSVVKGPEIEKDYYNFEGLNMPKDHPARDTQDSFYITPDILLRTQTSPVQVRTMEKQQPPIRIIAPGKVYRRDADVTHSPMFHQIEGLVVDKNISFGHLKGALEEFILKMFGADRKIRFRPHYFPFTEPSAEVDVSCIMCNGEGCRICSQTGWLEILGCGMVHPRVLEMAGYDPQEYSGFAFGLGVERIAMLKYRIDDIRLLFESDMRFLQQF